MQHVVVPTAEVMTLLVHPEMARINREETIMMAFIDENLHILVGDFKGIDTSADLEDIIKRNLKKQ